jgi:ribosomal protein S27AE
LYDKKDMGDYITLECPSCGGMTTFSGNTDRLLCGYCGKTHALRVPRRTKPRERVTKAMPRKRQRTLSPIPKEITVEKMGKNLRISRRWFSVTYIMLAFFCIAWDSFLCFWYGFALAGGIPWSVRLLVLVFPIAHLAVGVGLTYTTLAGFLNRTIMEVDGKTFKVHHKPLPWMGEVNVPIGDLLQLYCKEKRGSGENSNTTYILSAVLKNGRKIDVLSNLDSPDIALFVERQVESWLRITDRPVLGEYSS